MGCLLQEKRSILCSVVTVMRIVTIETARPLESRGFRSKVALYLSHLHIKFDDENKGISVYIQFTLSIGLYAQTAQGVNNIVRDANDIFMWSLYGHIHMELKQ